MGVLSRHLLGFLLLGWAATAPAAGGHNHGGHPHGGHHHHGGHAAPACPAALPSLACARSPTPAFGPDGRLWLTWYGGGHVYVQHSDDQGRHFSAPVAVNRVPEAVDDQGEDRPQIALGPKGEIYLLWTRKLDKPYTGHIRFSRSLDGGRSFSAPVNVNDDQAVIAHRFPTFQVDRRNRVHVVWIDKRDLEAAKADGRPYPGAALYYAVSTDGGQSFSASRKLADHSCECCRIGMALDDRNLPVLFYRHVFPGQIRDHALIRFDDPATPSAPARATRDDWRLEGCPHHGPALALSGETVHMAWFTAGSARQGLFYARHQGDEPGEPMALGGPGAERPMVAALGDTVVLAWKALDGDSTVIQLQRSDNGGQRWSAPETVMKTAGGSDHPLLVSDGQRIWLSWQSVDEGYRLAPVTEVRP